MKLLIVGGRVVDPSQGLDRVTNILVEDGKIAALDASSNGQDETINATGCIVAPGLVDMHAEFRDPGWEEDETIDSGVAAAAAGGFTSVACIPNTDPPIDSQASVEYVLRKASKSQKCRVYVIACVSKNRDGKELAEIGALTASGAVGFSDAGRPIHSAELMRRAMEYCTMFDRPVMNPPEVRELTVGGVMHEGRVSMVLGLGGIPAEAEDVMTGRDLRLAEATGGRLHLMCISSGGSVELIRRAKVRGVNVTCEITPMHFSMTDESLRTFDSNCKVGPPLRSRGHLDACIEGLKDGTIDVIASGHSPRAKEKKMLELDQAPFGVTSLETALALTVTHLIQPGHLDWSQAIAKLSCNPARILGIDRGNLKIGVDADITIIDPDKQWTVGTNRFYSKSRNTPMIGEQLTGQVRATLVDGRIIFDSNWSDALPC